jgi:hypothetical protein
MVGGDMSAKYILDSHGTPVREDDLPTWAKWFETADRRVAQDIFGDVRVSTVFLGLDHNFTGDAIPILFETMIFGGPHDQYQERYTTREEAIEGHREAVELAKTP